jgi:protein-S-isoprenylcysteine O-methyltransferase Ste14
MEWMPELKFGLFNGWVPLVLLALTDAILFIIFPREVVKRLWDRSGWQTKQVIYTVIGKVCALVCLVLLIFSPLKWEKSVFIMGMVVVVLGLCGLVKALIDFRNTPPDEPVVNGLYRISRHPQIVMSSVVLLGGCIAIGSWSAIIAWLVARIFSHFGILAEEEVCLRQYGDAYQKYLNRVPRYFLLF